MNNIHDITSRLDMLTQRTEDLARDIRILSNDVRRFHGDDKNSKS